MHSLTCPGGDERTSLYTGSQGAQEWHHKHRARLVPFATAIRATKLHNVLPGT
ncbi:uncharacterized protein FOMMEDRAFT_21952 [Fomitiporia mediterranea MF3/22]|uniref:uncharacterized protein n=1 Tax=Fomitiporia mediterranea (strain MF3/22) TaxID=694068 RepID=UPI00044081F8|nr:uncharacterized protein FOMMEDRAFT_21952 [Fomitiporia mediterranea MF3/22]EJD01593.1 hypothetical protein FOMMEDRAFT_21952 [Fomitiporia mediterranea MF3/22]